MVNGKGGKVIFQPHKTSIDNPILDFWLIGVALEGIMVDIQIDFHILNKHGDPQKQGLFFFLLKGRIKGVRGLTGNIRIGVIHTQKPVEK